MMEEIGQGFLGGIIMGRPFNDVEWPEEALKKGIYFRGKQIEIG